ncbi:hypothetical protein GO755_04775 [Spirosoma sp. HMF4905]|uniref:PA domain-containing protein n=1 Tax=Spirosoma arboris TaxID=2682092 RepID=A0A7K1S697_9BACT|nr:hypothetical protein [Spirosoma arboris]MVM29337.1 hypothetical protein [Spirosoma arboris]
MISSVNFVALSSLVSLLTLSQLTAQTPDYLTGKYLYSTVEKFVSLGEHRTGTETDRNTSAWLGNELRQAGYAVKYLEFPVKQFFFDKGSLSTGAKAINIFPLWYVNDKIPLQVDAPIVDSRTSSQPSDFSGKIVLTRLSGQIGHNAIFKPLIDGGAKAIVAITENPSGEIVAINTSYSTEPWPIPIVLVAPKDSANVLAAVTAHKTASLAIKGTFRDVIARNIYGKIGNGPKTIVVSTPISGWFTCGGERGPGIAAWLALAKWTSEAKLPYTFLFTANSGHELANLGARQFLETIAPKPADTQLWVHLGAGIATRKWAKTEAGYAPTNQVDANRQIVYSPTVKDSFEQVFQAIDGRKAVTDKGVGELIEVVKKGYPNFLAIAGAHFLFHAPTDDAKATSPELLEEITLALKHFIEQETRR